MFKLKNDNGRVDCLLRTGKDLVKNNLSISAAQHIIDSGKQTVSDIADYPISIDGKWYFKGEEIPTKKVNTSSVYGKAGK